MLFRCRTHQTTRKLYNQQDELTVIILFRVCVCASAHFNFCMLYMLCMQHIFHLCLFVSYYILHAKCTKYFHIKSMDGVRVDVCVCCLFILVPSDGRRRIQNWSNFLYNICLNEMQSNNAEEIDAAFWWYGLRRAITHVRTQHTTEVLSKWLFSTMVKYISYAER